MATLPIASGLVSVLTGLAVLCGWLFDVPLLQTLLSGFVAMKPNTAVCFVLAGVSLLLLARVPVSPRRLLLARGAALAVLGVAVVTLCEFVFDWRSGLGELLFKDPDRALTAVPGRMAITTVIVLHFLSLALLTLDWEPRRFFRPADWLTLLAIGIACMVLLQHLVTIFSINAYFGATPMALHSTVAVVALSLGILWSRPDLGLYSLVRSGARGSLERNIYLTVFTAVGALFFLIISTVVQVTAAVVATQMMRNSQEHRIHALSVLYAVQNVETSARAYALTGTKEFLTAYEQAVPDAEKELDALHALRRDDPTQVELQGELDVAVANRLRHAAEIVSTRNQHGLNEAAAFVAAGEGKRLMDAVRGIVKELDQETSKLLRIRGMEARESINRLRWILVLGVLVTVGIVASAVWGIRRGLKGRRETEEQLRVSEENLAITLRSIGDAVLTTDTEGRVTGLNPAGEQLTGWTERAAMGRLIEEIFQVIHKGTGKPMELPVNAVLQTGLKQSLADDSVLISREGTQCSIADSASPLYDIANQLRGVVLIFRDVTVQRVAELERERIFTLSGDMLAIFTPDYIFKQANPAFTRTLGWSADELLGHSVFELIHPDDLARSREKGEKLHAGESIVEFENRFRHKDNSWRVLSWRAVPQDGDVIFAAARDVTEFKKAEAIIAVSTAELRRAKAAAEAASRAKSTFLATMSHEIRTPMNGVIGTLDVLMQSSLRPAQLELADIIRESALSLLGVIDGILDFSKIEAGKVELERVPMPLEPMLESACDSLYGYAVRKQIQLRVFIDPHLPRYIFSDPLRFRQILNNLLSNAIKFSTGPLRQGVVKLRAEKYQATSMRISIADNGEGMTQATLDRLFTPFMQADDSTTRTFGGTGLGLSICKQLVTLLGGAITVESTPGAGSTFVVILPTEEAQDEKAEPAAANLVDVDCILVSPGVEIAKDWAAYLRSAGARATITGNLEAASQALAKSTLQAVTIIYDAPGSFDHQSLLDVFSSSPAAVTLLIIACCRHQRFHIEAPGVVLLDGNAMHRSAFLQGVAMAASRAELVEEEDLEPLLEDPGSAPTVDEAAAQGRLILVAEDNDINQKVIRHQLAVLGFACEVAGDGREALVLWRPDRHALLLADLHMPVLDGHDLAIEIRRREVEGTPMPIIAFTADITKGEMQRCREAGMNDYLTKPAQLHELKALLDKWLSGRAVEPEPEMSTVYKVAACGSEDPVAIFDPAVLLEMVGDDAAEFVDQFLDSAARAAAEMKSAVAAEDWHEVGRVAHRLMSSARWVGALGLGACCEQLQNAGRARDCDRVRALMEEFEQGHLAVIAAINKHKRIA